MAEIQLKSGHVVLVDDGDLAVVARFSWSVSFRGVHRKVARVRTRIGGRHGPQVTLARLLLGEPLCHVDHANGDGLDNRRCNLRLATATENSRNQRKTLKKSSSKYKGVHRRKNRHGNVRQDRAWGATIRAGGLKIRLGHFAHEVDAARAYDEAARRLHGAFAHTNF